MEKESSKQNKLVLTCDLGGSLSRAVAQVYPDAVPELIAMSPEVADVSKDSIKHLLVEAGVNDSAWVGLGEEYYALGTLARNNFAGTTPLRALKNKYALPKIAALLWQVCSRYKLKNPEVMIHLLLPSGETKNNSELSKQLTGFLKQGIKTPTGLLKAKLRNFYVLPEGSGVLSYRIEDLKQAAFNKSIGILMLGYRNSSFFNWDKGTRGTSDTNALGMSWMVQQFTERTSVGLSKDDLRLVKALFDGGNGQFDSLRSLSRKSTPFGIESDVQLFQEVLPTVRDEYCRALKRWLSEIGAVFDEILICGGTATFVRTQLLNYFQSEGISVIWNGGVQIPLSLDTHTLGERIADVWGSHISHIKLVDKKLGYERFQPLVIEPQTKPEPYEPLQETKPKPDPWKNYLPMMDGI
ncbi:hypothetical protein COO91_10437 (plasmid) [Nostoc flagelliforme CCNUN1]|uniref:Actin-like protein N-terminal domain-containing protein n=1 Tax=Nostoc flagelliforme CCNUN1 TaxID=2038116 RepID=A0A2K8T941_9NOSO|nr:ParM/StbA family protein [Nostoc flagelliforme]AUB44214.1 hypothetical protein COO91_10437 [Nostoc flagelliforme CCNUN1]